MSQTFLQAKLAEYMQLRDALGYKTSRSRLILQNFIEHLDKYKHGPTVRAQVAIDWACNSSLKSGAGQLGRLHLARGFLAHLKASFPGTEIPDTRLLATPERPIPYIFSTTELIKILEAAGEISQRRFLNPHTLQTLLGLMACTGLRPGEAIKLKVSDVQLDEAPPRLLIRCSKFDKSRWVPIHPTTADRLRHYMQWRLKLKKTTSSNSFFVSKKVRELKYMTLQRNFQDVIEGLEIHPRSGQLRPTLHSLRHTFAVQRLRLWYEEGADASTLIPNLSIYLGHVGLQNTYWYLSSTPELMGAAAVRFEGYAEQGGAA